MNENKARLVICNLDGTLYNDSGRKNTASNDKSDESIVIYHEAAQSDDPIISTQQILKGLQKKGHCLVFWTDRPEHLRESTEIWLDQKGFDEGSYSLYMRNKQDIKTSLIDLKEIWLRGILDRGFPVVCILDSDPAIEAIGNMYGVDCFLIKS